MKSDEEDQYPETVDNYDPEDIWLEHADNAYRLYRKLWTEFYDWEADDCQQTISGLKRYFPRGPLPFNPPGEYSRRPTEDSEWYILEDWNPHTGMLFEATVHSDPIISHKSAPHPRYSTCNSISRNVQSTPDFLLTSSFLPFADDPKFDAEKCLRMFDSLAWQTELQDPDREIIQLEVARRLYFDGLSFRNIDKLKILTIDLRTDESGGLIWSTSQRDLLLWPGSQMTALPPLPTKFVNPRLNIHENVMKDLPSFCSNLNCLSSRCHIHKEAIPIELPKPTTTNVMIKDSVGEPCDRDCYRTYDLDYFNEDNKWDDEAISLFNSVVKIVPDAEPCDLAVLCRMPCIEMYVQRLKTFNDTEIQENAHALNDEIQPRALDIVFEEDSQPDTEQWRSPVPPCNHPGACSQSANCACYNARKRCRRNCRCSKTCALRAKGCECGLSKKGKPCSVDSNCPCRRAHRECDPELCISCDARCSKKGRRCQNNQVQQARYLPIRISTGMFGLGAFAETDIPAHKYIGEYFGEIFSEPDSMEYISQIQKHTDLNYAFSLARGVQLDSHTIGNETRYLNHSQIPNCRARIIYVNGDPRIVLETEEDVKEGQELFLDYGPFYWNQGGPAHDDDDHE